MLTLTRTVGQSILIGDTIAVKVISIKGDKIRIGVEAPIETKLQRLEQVAEENKKGCP